MVAQPTESELAWKVDFEAKKNAARDAATPRWQAAEEAENQASALAQQIKSINERIQDLRKSDSVKRAGKISQLETERETLQAAEAAQREIARQEKSAGDSIWYAIFNLDIKNPNTIADDHGDPADLLAEYQKLLGEVSQTRNALKAELQSALASHRR